MKKPAIVILSVFLIATSAHAQFKIGLSVLPGIIANRVVSDVDTLEYSHNSGKFRAWIGLYADIEMKENYFFTTGVYWASKNLNLQMKGTGDPKNLDMNIQYLQVPLLLKLMTDEIALDNRLYFNIGPAFDFKIEETLGDQEESLYIDKINFWDLNFHLGAGLEFKIGQNTVLIGGLSYYRGMINSIKPAPEFEERLRVKNDFYAINLAIKF